MLSVATSNIKPAVPSVGLTLSDRWKNNDREIAGATEPKSLYMVGVQMRRLGGIN